MPEAERIYYKDFHFLDEPLFDKQKSKEEAKKIKDKNFLKPAEFLRPFGNFNGYNINFSFAEKFSINIKNFKLDFFDAENYKSYDINKFNESLELLVTYKTPDWDYKKVKKKIKK